MSFSLIFYIIATFMWVVAALLAIAEEMFLGLNALEWFLIGTPFFAAAHWIPGSTGSMVVHK